MVITIDPPGSEHHTCRNLRRNPLLMEKSTKEFGHFKVVIIGSGLVLSLC